MHVDVSDVGLRWCRLVSEEGFQEQKGGQTLQKPMSITYLAQSIKDAYGNSKGCHCHQSTSQYLQDTTFCDSTMQLD